MSRVNWFSTTKKLAINFVLLIYPFSFSLIMVHFSIEHIHNIFTNYGRNTFVNMQMLLTTI